MDVSRIVALLTGCMHIHPSPRIICTHTSLTPGSSAHTHMPALPWSLHLRLTCMYTNLQAVLKDGSSEARLVLAIKPLRPLAGAPRMLEELIAAEAAEAAGVTKATTQAVPGLALDRVSNRHHLSARSRQAAGWSIHICMKPYDGITVGVHVSQ